MGLRADQMLADPAAPHDLTLEAAAGDRLSAEAPWPEVVVVSAAVAPVRRLVHQTLILRARRPGEPDAPEEVVLIGRLVAELADGGEIEIQRDALPADAENPEVDTGTCAACGSGIVAGEAIVVDGSAYHPRCWSEDG